MFRIIQNWRLAIFVILTIVSIIDVSDCKGLDQTSFKGATLYVFNWSDYIDPELIRQFEQQTGAKVQYDNYSTEAELETKLITGDVTYDVVFPSDKSMSPLVKKGLLADIDKSLLPNLKTIDSKFLNPRFDSENKYSVPYFWGTAAIGIRTDKVKEEVVNFDILFNKKYKGKITMLDDPENVVAVAMLHLGKKMNSVDNSDLQLCERALVDQKELIQSYTSDSYKDKLISGEAWISLGWSGDILQASKENENIKAIIPNTGTMIWVDSIAIPKRSKNKRLAHTFMNFLLDPKIAAKNADFVQYATPNKDALELIDKKMLNNHSIYPTKEVLNKCEWLMDKGSDIMKIEALWEKVK